MELRDESAQELAALIQSLLPACRGNLVRVHEILTGDDYKYDLSYSTLTHMVRKHQLKEDGKKKRFGVYSYDPGVEMQHDSSPHRLLINGQATTTQCASLIFGYSRKLFIQYYPCFTRFEAKIFLQEALSFMGGSCQRCVIDNTSVILGAGAGSYAVVAQDMLFFSRVFGFTFMAHAVRDANRKGKIERQFHYAENNFLAGRTFKDWADLNAQARLWCEIANDKIKPELGSKSPNAVFILEKPTLIALPAVMPPIYKTLQRVADTEGCINLDRNRYSVPESHIGHTMDVHCYMDKIEIYYQHRFVARHPRIVGQRNKRITIAGHHPRFIKQKRQDAHVQVERQLKGHNTVLDAYLTSLKSHVKGRGMSSFKQLLRLKQTYPWDAFMAAVTQASRYGLYDMKRLETMILKQIRECIFNL